MADNYQYRDLTGLAKWLKFCLVAYIALALVGIGSGWLEISLISRAADGAPISEEEANANDLRQGAIGLLQIAVFIATGILFLRWIYLANKNARAMGAQGMEYSPGWSAGWYFIPLLALWKPYQAALEIFRASHPDYDENWRSSPRPAVLPIWWACWIISNFVGQIAFRISMAAETIPQLRFSSWATLLSDVIHVPLGLVAINVVTMLTSWQTEKYERVTTPEIVTSGGAGFLDVRDNGS